MAIEDVAVRIYRRVPMWMRPLLKDLWNRTAGLRKFVSSRLRARPAGSESDRRPQAQSQPGAIPSPDRQRHPLVTVVVPAYDEQRFLEDCLRSVAAQTLGDFECIVVDDASNDFTLDIASEWALRDPRFKVLHHETNRGLPGSRNSGLQAARGRFITFLDGDDFLFPTSLERRASALAAPSDDEVIGVYCDWMPVPEDAPLTIPIRPPVDKPDCDYLSGDGDVPFIATAPMLRIDLFRRFDGFNENLRSAEDFECWIRVMRHGYRFAYVKHVGVAYRQRRAGMVQGNPALHARVALSVLDYQSRPLIDAEVVSDTPYVFAEPLDHYHGQLRRIRRLAGSLALAEVSGREKEVDQIVELLPPQSWHYAFRALDLEDLVHRSLNRVARADPTFGRAQRDVAKAESLDRLEAALRRIAVGTAAVTALDRPGLFSEREPAMRVCEPDIVSVKDFSHRTHFGGVVLVPMARYHAEELVPLARELQRRGQKVSWLLTRFHPDDIRMEMRKYGVTRLFEWPEDLSALPDFASVVMLNDWGPTRDLVELARERGVPSFAKVEGVQDFRDVDTGRDRSPYRRADHVLCQGANDAISLADRPHSVVGSSRLERLVGQGERTFGTGRLLVVNSNFTYNVLTYERERWLASTIAACQAASVEVLVSQHQADAPLPADVPLAVEPMKSLLRRADGLISRFSTVPFEAMALGVPFIYHNPHGEEVPTFTQPDGAFEVTTDTEGLTVAIDEALAWRGSYRKRAHDFFSAQIDVVDGLTSAERAADVVLGGMGH